MWLSRIVAGRLRFTRLFSELKKWMVILIWFNCLPRSDLYDMTFKRQWRRTLSRSWMSFRPLWGFLPHTYEGEHCFKIRKNILSWRRYSQFGYKRVGAWIDIITHILVSSLALAFTQLWCSLLSYVKIPTVVRYPKRGVKYFSKASVVKLSKSMTWPVS